jgi:hypothetical protein
MIESALHWIEAHPAYGGTPPDSWQSVILLIQSAPALQSRNARLREALKALMDACDPDCIQRGDPLATEKVSGAPNPR